MNAENDPISPVATVYDAMGERPSPQLDKPPTDPLTVMDELRVVVAGLRYEALWQRADAARAAVAELVEADREYDAARRDWDHFTSLDPDDFTTEDWEKVASRFEEAVMRRIAALAKFGEG